MLINCVLTIHNDCAMYVLSTFQKGKSYMLITWTGTRRTWPGILTLNATVHVHFSLCLEFGAVFKWMWNVSSTRMKVKKKKERENIAIHAYKC